MKTDKIIWSAEGSNIMSAEKLTKLKKIIETSGPVIIKHWHFYGSCAPDWSVYDNYDDLFDYLSQKTKPGDAIDAWNASTLCNDNERISEGKIPNKEGLIPNGGAY